jgi:hypothetical protein
MHSSQRSAEAEDSEMKGPVLRAAELNAYIVNMVVRRKSW